MAKSIVGCCISPSVLLVLIQDITFTHFNHLISHQQTPHHHPEMSNEQQRTPVCLFRAFNPLESLNIWEAPVQLHLLSIGKRIHFTL